MLYQIFDGTVSVGGEQILSHFDFEIKGSEKIAVVGKNGAGKTTLLRVLAGEISLDRDDKRKEEGIRKSRKITIGFLHQNSFTNLFQTVEEFLLEHCPERNSFSRERYLYEMEFDRIFTGFGFDKKDKRRMLSSFSGGEKTKIAMIHLLLMKPDILLLDEPTNHLDIPTVEWLEQYMSTYAGAVIFVSHDRFFLDQVVNVVYELENGKLKRYVGNYSSYRTQKKKNLSIQKKAYDRQQAEIKRLNDLVEQFKHKPKKAGFARSRRSMLERMERIEKPLENSEYIFTGKLEPRVPGNKWMLEAKDLQIGYDKSLLELSLRIRRGQKIGIIGNNGAGKTTLLKTVAGFLPPLAGTCNLGEQTLLGYFDQMSASIQSNKNVLEHFKALYPSMTEQETRQLLGAYLFFGKDVMKPVNGLSGGEKARLVLAELLHSGPNFLIMDEPTNHMDIQAKEILESAFSGYTGTMLFVSHDRYFIEQVADAILVLEDNHAFYYPFGYVHYIERKKKNLGENPAALLRTEEQAMIADFKAVPKAERHRLKELSTQEAYFDWRLRLVTKPLEEAEQTYQQQWEQWIAEEDDYKNRLLELASACAISEESEKKEALNLQREALNSRKEKLDVTLNEWTKCCLEWYEVFITEK